MDLTFLLLFKHVLIHFKITNCNESKSKVKSKAKIKSKDFYHGHVHRVS